MRHTEAAVPPPTSPDITQVLQAWSHGDAEALDKLMTEVYPELRSMASRYVAGERSGTVQATSLVHDLYLRLLKQQPSAFPNRRAFFAFAAGAMRHILVDQVRARHAQKRGARRARVPLTEDLQLVDPSDVDLLDLHLALDELARVDPRKAEIVQLCAFLGCGRTEAAELLDISPTTAKRDLRFARAWLAQRLQADA
jgi:RNA polymerase sigma factor (TIGR02999 family)